MIAQFSFFPVDALSLLMLLLIGITFPVIIIYSVRFIKRNLRHYYWMLCLLLVGMAGAVSAKDLLSFYVFFEVITISTYFLIIHRQTKDSYAAAYKYLIMNLAAGAMLLFSILIIYNYAGSFGMEEISANLLRIPLGQYPIIAILFLSGCFLKAGAVPFHVWLPDAYPAAPSPISALLSGITVKIGLYGILRLLLIFKVNIPLLIIIGIFTMLIGVLQALRQNDIKRLLAFHSISQIGYVLLGFGSGGIGLAAGLLHLFNHGLFKCLLFLVAGSIIYATGEKKLSNLGGLARQMPVTFALFLVGAASITGIPPFNGFVSKALLSAAVSGSLLLKTCLFITAVLTFASFLKVYLLAFHKEASVRAGKIKEVPASMIIGMLVLAAACFITGVFPNFLLNNLISRALSSMVLFPFWRLPFTMSLQNSVMEKALYGPNVYSLDVILDTVYIIILGSLVTTVGLWRGWLGAPEKYKGKPGAFTFDNIYTGGSNIIVRFAEKLNNWHSATINTHLIWIILSIIVFILLW